LEHAAEGAVTQIKPRRCGGKPRRASPQRTGALGESVCQDAREKPAEQRLAEDILRT
jgi:hypothetical protein